MKNVLLLVHDDEGQEARLQAALDLTRALAGHLSCVDVSLIPVFVGDYYAGYYAGACEAQMLADERTREDDNKHRLTARLANEDVVWDWEDTTDLIAEAVLDRALLADIVVLNRRLDKGAMPDMAEAANRVLMHARVPVLAMPEGARGLRTDRALVAWDGQASSAATLRAVVPLLARARQVDILMVRDSEERLPPDDAARYLSRHGIHADIRVIDDATTPADRIILDEARKLGSDYIVMGAYGRGRLREVFGGVTRRMLAGSPLPLVLGH